MRLRLALLVATVFAASCDVGRDVDPAHQYSADELRIVASLSLATLTPLPPDPSNRFADNATAAAFGERLFADKRLSSNGEVACTSCHQPELHFTDARTRGRGVSLTRRHTPSLLGVAYGEWFYWDGRRDSQWAQALVPLEHPAEHAIERGQVLRLVAGDADYRAMYEGLFGPLPSPESAGERAVDRVFANVGKAIAAFERTLLPTAARFDRYAAALERGDRREAAMLMSPEEAAGLRLFIGERAMCTRCHNGPLLTNFSFHNIGLIAARERNPDTGRAAGVGEALADPFNCLGAFSDAKPAQCLELRFVRTTGVELPGAFKVPSLRNVAATAPYMHDGRFRSLREVLEHYRIAPPDVLGHQELEPLGLTDVELDQVAAFLGTLTGED